MKPVSKSSNRSDMFVGLRGAVKLLESGRQYLDQDLSDVPNEVLRDALENIERLAMLMDDFCSRFATELVMNEADEDEA